MTVVRCSECSKHIDSWRDGCETTVFTLCNECKRKVREMKYLVVYGMANEKLATNCSNHLADPRNLVWGRGRWTHYRDGMLIKELIEKEVMTDQEDARTSLFDITFGDDKWPDTMIVRLS
jgi:hypothetical protein